MGAAAEAAAWQPRIAGAVRGLGRDFFEERSVKYSELGVERDRILVGVRVKPRLRARLLALAGSLGLGGAALDEVDLRLGDAHMIHFGQEGRGHDAVRKVYLEFPTPPPDLPRLRFLAWKMKGGAVVRSAYRHLKDGPDLIGALVGFDGTPEILVAAGAVMERAAGRAGWPSLTLLEVDEPGTHRRSFDLNVYDANLKLGDVAADLSSAILSLGQPPEMPFPPGTRMGHVSGGVGRDGASFLTVYAGARLIGAAS